MCNLRHCQFYSMEVICANNAWSKYYIYLLVNACENHKQFNREKEQGKGQRKEKVKGGKEWIEKRKRQERMRKREETMKRTKKETSEHIWTVKTGSKWWDRRVLKYSLIMLSVQA